MKNKVELIGFYGGDETIACSAWTSTNRDLTDEKKKRIGKLINMLWSEGHETPFEKGIIHFLVDTEIASHIHLLKHRISSLNAESARYKELKEDKYYLPEDFKRMEYTDDEYRRMACHLGHTKNLYDALDTCSQLTNNVYHIAMDVVTRYEGRKRAKESSRFFKMYNSQIQSDVMFNMRSFANFVKLRNSEHAQLEIREVAAEMLRIVTDIAGEPFKETLEVFELRWELERSVQDLVKRKGGLESAIKAIKRMK